MDEFTGAVAMSKAPPCEDHPEAAALMAAAGWRPHTEWGVYTRGTLVMGEQPDRQAFHVKNWALVGPTSPHYGPDTPDTAEEAAAWLVARYVAQTAPPVLDEAGEQEQGAGDESASLPDRDIAQADPDLRVEGSDGVEGPAAGLGEHGGSHEDQPFDEADLGTDRDPIDAEFSEAFLETYADLAAPELGEDIVAAEEEAGGSQFIFGDNLDQMRTAAIGLVMRHARALTPPWPIENDAALAELRNFTMGVSEGRWPDDAGRRAELDDLEATLARMNAVARARDEKVEFLEGASRDDLTAFDATADWP